MRIVRWDPNNGWGKSIDLSAIAVPGDKSMLKMLRELDPDYSIAKIRELHGDAISIQGSTGCDAVAKSEKRMSASLGWSGANSIQSTQCAAASWATRRRI